MSLGKEGDHYFVLEDQSSLARVSGASATAEPGEGDRKRSRQIKAFTIRLEDNNIFSRLRSSDNPRDGYLVEAGAEP